MKEISRNCVIVLSDDNEFVLTAMKVVFTRNVLSNIIMVK